ncbi:MAG: hypothetical protein AABN95_05760 [Acidobacteriota bacterium]
MGKKLVGSQRGNLKVVLYTPVMTDPWIPRETTTHQDHVIAHVLGATVRGYFAFDEALHLLLDIGFVWTILLDGEMALLPHPVAIGEMELEERFREEIRADIDLLLSDNQADKELLRMHAPSKECGISEVNFFEQGERRRLLLTCEEASLAIETSLTTAEIQVYDVE